jgi:GT2 family glycosyltransferase
MAEGFCSIIIPVHNKAALTRQCLESIFASAPLVGAELVVVDDASTDSTQEVLESYGDRVRSVRLKRNSGFATACNTGAAAAAAGRHLVFLNNDTIAMDGWLDELVGYAEAHPEASVVGNRLLYPDMTVQHAGVVFSIAGDPLHLYAGFPGDHPAVTKSRRFQAVTAACMLIRREVFEEVGGFDTDYHNDLEDVDLCLRLGQRGYEVHYCHTSTLFHLEQASRAFRFHEGRSAELYRARWAGRVRSDEFDYYLEDGLMDVLRYPPDRAKLDSGRSQREAEILQVRSRQLLALLRETLQVASQRAGGAASNGRRRLRIGRGAGPSPSRSKRQGERKLEGFRHALASSLRAPAPEAPQPADELAPTPREEGYEGVVAEVGDVVEAVTPPGATVLVVSKGDGKLVDLRGRQGWHFPRAEDGRYRGYYPAGDDDAIADLEGLREQGAEFLALPEPALWWLEHYPGFARLLTERYLLAARGERCMVFDLRDRSRTLQAVDEIAPAEYASLTARVRRVVAAIVPQGAIVLTVSKGDEALVDIPGRRGWHFPRAEDGRYGGYYPADDDAAIAHLETLRKQGADFLAFPATAFWWLDSYPGFSQLLLERHGVAAWTDDCIVFDLRLARGPVSVATTPAHASSDDAPKAPVRQLGEARYAELVERVRNLVETTVPSGATTLVVSKGDEKLIDLPGHRGCHFPGAPDGGYRGYYPAGDEDAIAHLEGLRSAGAEYLVFPSTALWWLDHYARFAAHLRERYATAAYEYDTGIVFELGGRLEPSVVANLIPTTSRIAVSTNFTADLAALADYDAVQLFAGSVEEAIDRLEVLVGEGVEFLVIPRGAFAWHEEHFGFREHLRGHHRFVTHQQHACEIWELEPASQSDDEVESGAVQAGVEAHGRRPENSSVPRERPGIFRLWWKRRR